MVVLFVVLKYNIILNQFDYLNLSFLCVFGTHKKKDFNCYVED